MSNEINANVRVKADLLKSAMTVGDKGAITVEQDWYIKNLPADITPEQLTALQEDVTTTTAALALAAGELAAPIFKEDESITEASAHLNIGAHRIPVTVVRDYTHGKESYHGHVIAGYEVNATGPDASQLTTVISHVRALADDLLG